MKSERIRNYILTLLTASIVIVMSLLIKNANNNTNNDKTIKVAFIYVGDMSDAYTNNFIKAQEAIEKNMAKGLKPLVSSILRKILLRRY